MIRSILCLAVLAGGLFPAAADPPRKEPPTAEMVEAAQRFSAIKDDWNDAERVQQRAVAEAKTKAERAEAWRRGPDPEPFAARCRKLHADHPDTWGGRAALYWVACHAGKADADKALAELEDGVVATGDLDALHGLFSPIRGDPRTRPARKLNPLVSARTVANLEHPAAADLLVWVCQVAAADPSPAAAKLFRDSGDRLVTRFPEAQYLWVFCDLLRESADPVWAEGKLRAVLTTGEEPANRLAASFALATILRDKDDASQAEAERLFRFVVETADRTAEEWNDAGYKRVRTFREFPRGPHWVPRAEAALEAMAFLAPGKPAPALAGIDLDGKPLSLVDYRGKVVLVSFWATWCPPCLALIPQEKKLAERMAGQPFALLGVNGDDDPADARRAAAENGVAWPSVRDRPAGTGPTHSRAWKVGGWPTLYLIDHAGVVRKRWAVAPSDELLGREVDRLVAAVPPGR